VRIQLNWFGEKLAARLADIETGRVAPAAPRDAATVVILRSAQQPPEAREGCGPDIQVLMLRRTAAMKFAPGAYVFPGGSVDPADYGTEVDWHGPSPAEFGARLGASAEVARALVCAAVRETFEESGVLLAGVPGAPPAVPAGPSWDADRAAAGRRPCGGGGARGVAAPGERHRCRAGRGDLAAPADGGDAERPRLRRRGRRRA
jgi:8-oxo-dGTP pyrophosphatase MutT (NUDIX family)